MKSKISIVLIVLAFGLSLAAIPSEIWAQANNNHNQKIERSVEKRLQDQQLTKGNEIAIAVEGKTVVLTGTVSDIHQMNEVEKQTGKAARGYIIVNNLAVTQANLTDQQLRDNVEKQIQKNVFYSIYDWVEFDVNNGEVKLAGWVRESWNKRQFEHAIQKVPGVIKLDDQIQIESQSIFDDEVRNQAANLIYNDPYFVPSYTGSGAPIHIIVNDGNVYLEGQVSRADMRDWAENTVYMNTKAFQVFDDLKVQNDRAEKN